MSRAQRLLNLMEHLRQHRRPVSGQALADALEVSLRTLYRDIETLRTNGAPIDGEAGIGYQLQAGYVLPPLTFSRAELEAIVLGMRWVERSTDADLGAAAKAALTKIAAVLPSDLRHEVDACALFVGRGCAVENPLLPELRAAMRSERRVRIAYCDAQGVQSERVVWPFAIGFFDGVRMAAAWCELREGYRNFRLDRIQALSVSDKKFGIRRKTLLRDWQKAEGFEPL